MTGATLEGYYVSKMTKGNRITLGAEVCKELGWEEGDHLAILVRTAPDGRKFIYVSKPDIKIPHEIIPLQG